MNPVVAVSIIGGLLAVDYRSSLGLMVSQPICGGLLTGLMLGEPAEGMLAGALMQMIFLGHIPVRGEQIPDLPTAGVAAAALYILVGRAMGDDPALGGSILFFSLLMGLLCAVAGHYFYRWWERRATALAAAAAGSAAAGRFRRVSAMHLSTVALHFAYAYCVICFLAGVGCPLLARAAAGAAGVSDGALGQLAALVPFIAVGSLLRLHFIKTRAFWFGAGFLVAYVLLITRG